jgi:hypothetical protein
MHRVHTSLTKLLISIYAPNTDIDNCCFKANEILVALKAFLLYIVLMVMYNLVSPIKLKFV